MDLASPQSSATTPDPTFAMDDLLLPTPAAPFSVTKAVKKRKSWGQELPEPKTALPPRKRAKTEDEKEQRRIERIKRNRAAAHNSRERKRVEAEQLATANEALVKQINSLQRRLAVQAAQLAKCKEQLGGSLPEVTDSPPFPYNRRFSVHSSSSGTPSHAPTIDPRASLSRASPMTPPPDNPTPHIKIEDPLATPLSAHFDDKDDSLCGSLDQTQHSAVMLWDLQCRSTEPCTLPSPLSTSQAWAWTRMTMYLMNLCVLTCYRTILSAFWTHWPPQMNRLLTAWTPCSTLTTRHRHATFPTLTPLPNWLTLARHILPATVSSPLGISAVALSWVQTSGRVSAFDAMKKYKENQRWRCRDAGLAGYLEAAPRRERTFRQTLEHDATSRSESIALMDDNGSQHTHPRSMGRSHPPP